MQPLEGVGDGLEYAVRMLTFGGAVVVSCLLAMEVAVTGAVAAKGFVEALKFLKPFPIAVSPGGAATLEYSLAPAKDFVQASAVALGQAAQGLQGIAEQCGHLFTAGNGGPGGGDWTNISGILRKASRGKGNFGVGEGSRDEAIAAGKAWVGDGYKVSSDGKTLVSTDGLRQFRPPTFKPRLGKIQANFEWRNISRGQWQGNGHLDIVS